MDDVITIVSGLPRSGTSLMMQMLEAGGMPVITDDLREADEDNPRGYYELEAVKRTKDDQAWLQGARGKVVKVIYLLLYDLPATYNYRVIFMRRPLSEIVASQQTMLARSGKEGTSLSDGQFTSLLERELSEIDEWLGRQEHCAVHNVNYHDLLNDGESAATALNDSIGGDLDVEAMQRVIRPELHRQRH
ncbi:MAG: sulfotransferase family protein [Lentisphaeria bacterium]|nr:sulfotransferase family protein [Lentisphaeria bacterium]